MNNFKIDDEVWIISFETEADFYLLSKQIIVALEEEHAVCEDDFNTFHVDYDDIYLDKKEALSIMIEKLKNLKSLI